MGSQGRSRTGTCRQELQKRQQLTQLPFSQSTGPSAQAGPTQTSFESLNINCQSIKCSTNMPPGQPEGGLLSWSLSSWQLRLSITSGQYASPEPKPLLIKKKKALTLISKCWKTETLFCKLKCVSKHTLISCLFIYTCACVWVCAHGMPSCACWNKITTYGAHYSSIFEFKKFFLHNSCNNL